MSKRTVLIVDDEKNIGILVEKLIHWEELQLELLAVLSDGQEALEKIRADRPDIVITDIRMPVITGLDLIAKTQEEAIPVNFIVMSGYKEFEYAHKALEFGVDSYILKPINEEDLNKALSRVCERLDGSEEQARHNLELQERVDKSHKIIKGNCLQRVLEGGQDLAAELQAQNIQLPGECFRGIDLKLDAVSPEKMTRSQDNMVIVQIRDRVERILPEAVEELLYYVTDDLHTYCLLNYRQDRSEAARGAVNELLTAVKEFLTGLEQYEVTIGVGEETTELSNAASSLQEAYRAVCNRMRLGNGRLIFFDKEEMAAIPDAQQRYEKVRRELQKDLDTGETAEIKWHLADLFGSQAGGEFTGMYAFYEFAEELIAEIFSRLPVEETIKEEEKRALSHRVACSGKLPQIHSLLASGFERAIRSAQESEEAKEERPIRLAREYVEAHYMEKLTLEDVAEHVELNAVYFSTLFKKQTGINFSAYLQDVRLAKAKELLITTNETVASIAEACGYPDQKYFSQVFKKGVGVKPNVYRKLHA